MRRSAGPCRTTSYNTVERSACVMTPGNTEGIQALEGSVVVKPANFAYHRPKQLSEAMNLLTSLGDAAKLIAGGQSLVPMMNMRLARPEHVIDINDLDDLNYIRKVDDRIRIGALTRQSDLESSNLLRNNCPLIPETVGYVGHYAIRQRGTVGGSIAHADPVAELPLLAVLLEANMTVVSSEGTRSVSAEDFFITIYTTDLAPNELISEVDFPVFADSQGWSYQQLSRRAGDFALVSAGSVLSVDETGRVDKLNVAVAGADVIPLNLSRKLADFQGAIPNVQWIESVAAAAVQDVEPDSDLHATASDRLEWLELMIKRTLTESLQRTEQTAGAKED